MAELQSKISLNLKEYITELQKAVDLTTKAVQGMSGKGVSLDVDADGLTSVQKEIDGLISSLADQNIVIDVDAGEVAGAKADLNSIKGTTVNASVDVDTGDSKATLNELSNDATDSGKNAGKNFSIGFNDILKGALAASVFQGLKSLASDAVSGFIDLNKNVANIGTLGVENFEQFTSLALEASKIVPDSAANIAAGAYQAISAGITGTNEEIIAFTQTASKVATAGLATTEEAVNGLTSVLNAYGKEASDVGEASDTFFAAIKLGKTSFNELNAGLANVIPAASAAGISFEEVAGNIAQITALGVPTAQATTQLRSAIIELQKPGDDLAKVMSGVTVELDGVKQTLTENNIGAVLKKQGLTATLQQIEEAASASGKTLTQAFSSSEAASAALLLTGENAERANSVLKNVRKEIEGGVSGKAYEVAAQSIDAQLSLLANNAQAIFSEIFEALTPIVSAVLEGLNPIIQSVGFVIDNFDKLALGIGIGAAAFGVYTVATSGAAIATSAAATATGILNSVMLLNPAVAIAAGIGALVVAGLALADAFSDTTEELQEANKAEQDLLAQKKETLIAQKSQIEGNRDLIAEYEKTGLRIEELRKKEKLSEKEKEELTNKTKLLKEQQLKLNDVYPDAIKGTKSFAENLKSVKEETGLQNANLSKLSDNTKKLITDFEELGKKENKSAEEKKRLKEITTELALEFPKAGISSEDFAGSLSRVKEAAGLTFKQLDNVNGAITKLGLQQKKLQNEDLNLQFQINQEEIEKQLDEINTDIQAFVLTRGLDPKEFKIAEFISGLKKKIQYEWNSDKLDNLSIELQTKLSDKLDTTDADATIKRGVQTSFLKFIELQKQRIALNKSTSESQESSNKLLDDASDKTKDLADKTEDLGAKASGAKAEIADLSNFAKDLQGTKSILFDVKTDFEFGNLTIEEALDFFNNGVALTGDVTILNEIDKELEKIQLKKDILTESEQFIQLQIDGTDKIIADLSKVRNEKDKTLKDLEKKKLGFEFEITTALDTTKRLEILNEIDKVNKEIVQRTIETSTESIFTVEQLKEISNKRIASNTLENTKKLNEELSKAEQQLLDIRLKLTDKTDRDIQKLRLENSAQTQEVLKQLEVLELQDRLAAELNEYKGNADAQLIIKKKYIKLFSDLDKKYAVTTTDLYEDLANSLLKSLASYDATTLLEENKKIEQSILSVSDKYNEDLKELQDKLKSKELSQKDYNDAIIKLEEEKNNKLKELEDQRVGFAEIAADNIAESFKGLNETISELIKERSNTFAEAIESDKETNTEFTEFISENMALAVASIGASLGEAVANGENFFQSLIRSTLSTAQVLLNAWAAPLLLKANTELPLGLGTIEFGLLLAAANTLLATAQAGIGGANDGVVGLTESNKGKPRGADSIPMMLAPNESVMTAKATRENADLFSWMNKTGKHWREYPELSTFKVGKNFDINKLKTDSVQTNPVIVNNTDYGGLSNKVEQTNRELKILNNKQDKLYEKFGKIDVRHFHNKQPTVNNNVKVEIKDPRGRL